MIILKTKEEIEQIRKANQIIVDLYKNVLPEYIKPGVSTYELDKVVEDYIRSRGAIPATIGYGAEYGNPYPAASCISVNEMVVHGIPRKDIILKEGDIVTVDTVTELNGFFGDTAHTFCVGEVDEKAQKLIEVTKKAREIGIEAAKVGARLGDVGNAIQRYVEKEGFSIVREFCGHGVGKQLHEDPIIPHYGRKGRGLKIQEGMVFTIEPIVNEGSYKLRMLPDNWTAVTKDGKRSAQFEHSIAIVDGKAVILSNWD